MKPTADEAMELTLSEIAENCYMPEKEARRRPNTCYGYASSLRLHVLPKWGDMRIRDMDRDDVQAWVDSLVAECGAGGAWKAYKCLRQVINWAIRKWALFVANPTVGIEKPRMARKKTKALSQRSLKRLIRGFVGHEFETTVVFSAALGLRPSESYAIEWGDVNWRTGAVVISKSLHQLPGLVYESATKTTDSERELYLPAWALDRVHQIWAGLGRPKGRIIGDSKPEHVARRVKDFIKKERLPKATMKVFRHTWATIAAGAGVSIETVAAMLGHSGIATCYRYYIDLTRSAQRKAQRRVGRSVMGKCEDMYKGIDLSPLPACV